MNEAAPCQKPEIVEGIVGRGKGWLIRHGRGVSVMFVWGGGLFGVPGGCVRVRVRACAGWEEGF